MSFLNYLYWGNNINGNGTPLAPILGKLLSNTWLTLLFLKTFINGYHILFFFRLVRFLYSLLKWALASLGFFITKIYNLALCKVPSPTNITPLGNVHHNGCFVLLIYKFWVISLLNKILLLTTDLQAISFHPCFLSSIFFS